MPPKRRKINGNFSSVTETIEDPINFHLLPETSNTYDVGSTSLKWRAVHAVTGIFNSIAAATGVLNVIGVAGHLIPSSSSWQLGEAGSVWASVYATFGVFNAISHSAGSGTPISFLSDIITDKVNTDALEHTSGSGSTISSASPLSTPTTYTDEIEHRSGTGSTITVNSPTSFSSTIWTGGIGIRPLINNTMSLGEAALLWTEAWCTRLYTSEIRPLLTVVNCFGHLKPNTTDYDMGDAGTPWRRMYSTRFSAYPDNENGIGVTGTNYLATDRFYVASHSSITRFYVNGNGDCFNLTGVYGLISDEKMKKNIVDTSSVLDKVKKINIKNYDLVTDTKDKSERCGFIAQDLQKIFPEVVTSSKLNEDDKEETLAVASSLLIPILIKAIQELEQKIKL